MQTAGMELAEMFLVIGTLACVHCDCPFLKNKLTTLLYHITGRNIKIKISDVFGPVG